LLSSNIDRREIDTGEATNILAVAIVPAVWLLHLPQSGSQNPLLQAAG